ncbi:glycosyltransferase [Flaviflexus massiliensis]|uniref:glycosyltransferase n=1 Tax=Flaviflexus massiliensis TaxID=1522309 RepID=UPI0006D594A6|nr:glycosyltransferase [Flaviflexus massiliensis]
MIGYYVHHQGQGHRMRALQIALALRAPVVGFSSLEAPEGWPGRWVMLEPDLVHEPLDPTANGVFHWAPLEVPRHRTRLARIVDWLTGHVDVMVVDTSAEVTLLSRLFGVRTVVVALRGDRTDRPHLTAYDAASAIIAPWNREHGEPWWPPEWEAKTVHTGAFSRFDGIESPPPSTSDVPRVLVVWGSGGDRLRDGDLAGARRATPGWEWILRTPEEPSPDLWRELAEADVVVTHAGDNAVAEVAAARRPAVVVAQPRPFDEQGATVGALRRAGACVALEDWPSNEDWPILLKQATSIGGQAWRDWNPGDGARRAAAALDRLHEEVQ